MRTVKKDAIVYRGAILKSCYSGRMDYDLKKRMEGDLNGFQSKETF